MDGRRQHSVPRVVWVVAAVAAVGLCLPLLWHQIHAQPPNRLVDLEVYRDAGESVRIGRDVYQHRTPLPQALAFTYPPFAALLSLPLALASFTTAAWAWEVVSLLLLIWLVAFCFRPLVPVWRAWLDPKIGTARAAWATALLAPMVLPAIAWLEPVRTTFRFGQVNVLIAALVVADCCTAFTRWPRGMLIGVAAAIKLTPGLFIPYLWLSGRRRAAYVATATFVGCQLLAAAVVPDDSKQYWTDALFNSERLGSNAATANVAIRGALLRLHLPHPIFIGLVVIGVLAFLVIGMSRALLASKAGAELAGVALVGLTSVAVSPVSWDHHLIWLVPAFALLLADPWRPRRLLAAAAAGALFYTRIPWTAARLLRSTEGIADAWWRTLNLSFTIAVLILVVALPLKSLTQLSRPWGTRSRPL
ncbi:MAG: glycosyltransferase 87 family protein [Mycobacteriales bacterium]